MRWLLSLTLALLLLPEAGGLYTIAVNKDSHLSIHIGPSKGGNITFQPNFTVTETSPEGERVGGLYIFRTTGWVRVEGVGKEVAVEGSVVRNSTLLHAEVLNNYFSPIDKVLFSDGEEAFDLGGLSPVAHLEVDTPVSEGKPPSEAVLDILKDRYSVELSNLPFSLPSSPSLLLFVSFQVADFTVQAEEGVDGVVNLLIKENISYEVKLPRLNLSAAVVGGGDVRVYINNSGEDNLDLRGKSLYVEVRDENGYPILTDEVNLTDVLSPGDSLRYLLDLNLKPGKYNVYLKVDGKEYRGVLEVEGEGGGGSLLPLLLLGVILIAAAVAALFLFTPRGKIK